MCHCAAAPIKHLIKVICSCPALALLFFPPLKGPAAPQKPLRRGFEAMIDVGLMAKSTPFLKPKHARLTLAKPGQTFFFFSLLASEIAGNSTTSDILQTLESVHSKCGSWRVASDNTDAAAARKHSD